MTSEECEAECEPSCGSILNPNAFGLCDLVLGYAVFNGQCIAISGCDAGETILFETQEECQKTCGIKVVTIQDVIELIDVMLSA